MSLNDYFALGRQAAEQLARVVKRVESAPRSRRVLRRRSVGRANSGTAGIAVLLESLNYGTTVGALANIYGGTPGEEQPMGQERVFEWKLLPGDSIAPKTEIDVNLVNGYWYMGNAACEPDYSTH